MSDGMDGGVCDFVIWGEAEETTGTVFFLFVRVRPIIGVLESWLVRNLLGVTSSYIRK